MIHSPARMTPEPKRDDEERPRVTVKNVHRLPPPPRGQIEYMDCELPGFFLRVSSTGARSFVIRYRLGGRNPKRYTIGPTPPLELGKTREKARHLLSQVKLARQDPAVTEAQENGRPVPVQAGPSFAVLAEQYVEARENDHEK